jgi:hypothetical protein
MVEALPKIMARHRALARVLKEEETNANALDMPERLKYFRVKALRKEHYNLTIFLLVQVPDHFVQKLIDQTFLK